MAVALALTRRRRATVPVLEIDGRRIGDLTAIIATLVRRHPIPPLYPADLRERRRALELEGWFGEELGPYVRRLVFYEGRQDREGFDEAVSRMAPANLARHKRAGGAAASRFTVVRFGAGSSRAAERARGRVLAALDRLEAELGDEDYLVGGRFRRGYRWVEEMFRRHRRPA